MEPLLVSIKEASRLLGCGRTKIYQLIAENRLETIMIGSRRLIRFESVKALAEGSH